MYNNDAVNKSYVDGELAKQRIAQNDMFEETSRDAITGDLILQSQPYPIQENTNKAVSYRAARDIFLSRKKIISNGGCP